MKLRISFRLLVMKSVLCLSLLTFCYSFFSLSAEELKSESLAITPEKAVESSVDSVENSGFSEELKTSAPSSLAEVKLLEDHVQQLIEKIRPATVSIFGGSGVVIGEEGYILSAAHVLGDPGRRTRIRFPSGKRAIAVTLGSNERYDSGLAKIIRGEDFPYLEMGDSAELEQGEWCLAVGFPVSFSRSEKPPVRLGRVLVNRNRNIMTDCPLMGGDSGGPLFNLDGQVVGINSRVSGRSLNGNVHVPVDIFKRDWESLKKSEVYDKSGKLKPSPAKRGYLGIHAARRNETAVIGRVIDGSAADKAGMKPGDTILEVAGNKTKTFRDVVSHLSKTLVGDKLTFKIRRDKQVLELEATLGKRP